MNKLSEFDNFTRLCFTLSSWVTYLTVWSFFIMYTSTHNINRTRTMSIIYTSFPSKQHLYLRCLQSKENTERNLIRHLYEVLFLEDKNIYPPHLISREEIAKFLKIFFHAKSYLSINNIFYLCCLFYCECV